MKRFLKKYQNSYFIPYFVQTELLQFPPEYDEDVLNEVSGQIMHSYTIEECDLLIVAGAIHKKSQVYFEQLINKMLSPRYVILIDAPSRLQIGLNSDQFIKVSEIINIDYVITSLTPTKIDYLDAIQSLRAKVVANE